MNENRFNIGDYVLVENLYNKGFYHIVEIADYNITELEDKAGWRIEYTLPDNSRAGEYLYIEGDRDPIFTDMDFHIIKDVTSEVLDLIARARI